MKRRKPVGRPDKKRDVEVRDDALPFSPYRVFARDEWARLRADTPMTLEPSELEQLSGVIEEISVEQVEQIFLPLSRLAQSLRCGRSEAAFGQFGVSRPKGHESPFRHRRVGLGCRRQEHVGTCSESAC